MKTRKAVRWEREKRLDDESRLDVPSDTRFRFLRERRGETFGSCCFGAHPRESDYYVEARIAFNYAWQGAYD